MRFHSCEEPKQVRPTRADRRAAACRGCRLGARRIPRLHLGGWWSPNVPQVKIHALPLRLCAPNHVSHLSTKFLKRFEAPPVTLTQDLETEPAMHGQGRLPGGHLDLATVTRCDRKNFLKMSRVVLSTPRTLSQDFAGPPSGGTTYALSSSPQPGRDRTCFDQQGVTEVTLADCQGQVVKGDGLLWFSSDIRLRNRHGGRWLS